MAASRGYFPMLEYRQNIMFQALKAALFVFCFSLFFYPVRVDAWQDNSTYRSTTVETGQASSTLIAEGPLVPGEITWFALDQQLNPHWHVYWKNPGDSGLPLVMNWELPAGYAAGEIEYPVPSRIPVGPLVNFGYEGNPVFLIPVRVPANASVGTTFDIAVKAGWLICEDVCIPEEADFSIAVPVSAASQIAPEHEGLFAKARENIPPVLDNEGVFARQGDEIYLQIDSEIIGTDAGDVFFFSDLEGMIVSAAKQDFVQKGQTLTLAMEPDFAFKEETGNLPGLLTYTDKQGVRKAGSFNAIRDDKLLQVLPLELQPQFDGATTSSAAPQSSGNSALPLSLLLVMAFFGGIILNIMPCVFPILFIKASSFMASAHEDRATIRLHGWLYTAGVVTSFIAIGGLLLLLRAGGESLGWGFHLQSPIVVLASSLILLLVGLNLAGVFHVGTSVQGIGEVLTAKQNGWGSFFTGVLAVLVAAPCIGPLLSAPMGAAVLLPPLWGLLIFIIMAFGLAFPYLLISLMPGLGRMLPKPGAWMDVMKRALSFPVFAAAAYFLWVLAAQTGSTGLAIGLSASILLSAAAWVFEIGKTGGPRKWALRGLFVILILAAFIPMRNLKPVSAVSFAGAGAKHGAIQGAIAFDGDEIARLNASGQDVFVDFTAAWCVTCQFNKLTIFSSDNVADAFSRNNTQMMVADWTVRDEKITAALESFDRNGVPLYVHYRAGSTPQILDLPITEKSVINTISSK